ncbi:MASE1 domain-containing protein [Myxococcaceae bacterium GXIMD 01537]
MAGSEHIFQEWPPLARLGLFAVTYAASVHACAALALAPEHLSALWLPSGVVLGFLLLSRGRDWPAIALTVTLLGPFLYAAGRPPTLMGFLLAGASALEGLTSALLLRRVAHLRPSLERVRDVAFLALAVAVTTGFNAAVCVGLMGLSGDLSWARYGHNWHTFWVGSALGVLALTPLLLAWTARRLRGWSPRHGLELAALLVALGLAAHFAFQVEPPSEAGGIPLKYHLLFPCVLLAAVRFEARGSTAATAVLCICALWHTLHGPFGAASHADPQRLAFLQTFLATVAASGLLLAAALAERRRARDEVASLNQELRQSLETLAKAQVQLVRRERMAALGELAATVAHEVRNPLGAIANAQAALRRMVRPADGAAVEPLFDIIDEEVHRLDHLVGGLLDFTRPVEPRRLPQPLSAVLEGALVAALRSVPSPGVTVVKDLEADLGPVPLDVQLLHVALGNLFTNALQAMPEGGTLSLRLERVMRGGAAFARLTLHDTGRGIPEELQARIFEPFFTTRATGTGLGLAIVRRIIEAHRGEVEVHSAVGQGTTFVVHLPCAPESARLPSVAAPVRGAA